MNVSKASPASRCTRPPWVRLLFLFLLLITGASAANDPARQYQNLGDQQPTCEFKEDDAVSREVTAAVGAGLVGVELGRVTPHDCEIGVAGVRRTGTNDTLSGAESFLLGSNTKAMTAYITARLIDRGVLRWDSTIAEVIPNLEVSMLSYYTAITLEQLLAHRGGVLAMSDEVDTQRFQDYLGEYSGDMPQSLQQRRLFFARWLLSQPPPVNVVPGQDFYYSNGGYALVGAMLEAATGKTFEALFEEELSRSLGVTGSWLRPELMAPDQPVGHSGLPGSLQVELPLPAELQQWVDVLAPSGPFSITAAAYATWLHWHLQALRGRATPLPVGYVQRLQQLASGDYALGWIAANDSRGRPVLFHAGSEPGFMSGVIVDIAGRYASFGLTNTQYADADGNSWVMDVLFTRLIAIAPNVFAK